jgi:hypothetical protein
VSVLHAIVSWAAGTTFKLWSKLWAGGAVSVVECRRIEKTVGRWCGFGCRLKKPVVEISQMARRAHGNLLLSQRSTDGRNKIVKILQMVGTQKPFAFSKLDMSKSKEGWRNTEIFCFLEHRFNNIFCKHM